MSTKKEYRCLTYAAALYLSPTTLLMAYVWIWKKSSSTTNAVPTGEPAGEFSWIDSEPKNSISDGASFVSCTLIVKLSTKLNPVE